MTCLLWVLCWQGDLLGESWEITTFVFPGLHSWPPRQGYLARVFANECLLVGIIICFVPVSCFHSGWREVFCGEFVLSRSEEPLVFYQFDKWKTPLSVKWIDWKTSQCNCLSKCELSWDEDCCQKAAFQEEDMKSCLRERHPFSYVGKTVSPLSYCSFIYQTALPTKSLWRQT